MKKKPAWFLVKYVERKTYQVFVEAKDADEASHLAKQRAWGDVEVVEVTTMLETPL